MNDVFRQWTVTSFQPHLEFPPKLAHVQQANIKIVYVLEMSGERRSWWRHEYFTIFVLCFCVLGFKHFIFIRDSAVWHPTPPHSNESQKYETVTVNNVRRQEIESRLGVELLENAHTTAPSRRWIFYFFTFFTSSDGTRNCLSFYHPFATHRHPLWSCCCWMCLRKGKRKKNIEIIPHVMTSTCRGGMRGQKTCVCEQRKGSQRRLHLRHSTRNTSRKWSTQKTPWN